MPSPTKMAGSQMPDQSGNFWYAATRSLIGRGAGLQPFAASTAVMAPIMVLATLARGIVDSPGATKGGRPLLARFRSLADWLAVLTDRHHLAAARAVA